MIYFDFKYIKLYVYNWHIARGNFILSDLVKENNYFA